MSTFFGSPAIIQRSVFVDKGPIVKPPELLASGLQASITGPNTVTLVGGSFTSADVGLEIDLSGAGVNVGRYRIVKVNSPTSLQLFASFTTPDVTVYSWGFYNPRRGEIADSPLDVVVRVNGIQVLPVAVDGLLGQVVLASTPLSTDVVDINYLWLRQPTVRLNLNHEGMTLNASKPRGTRRVDPKRHHSYSYNVVLSNPTKLGISDSALAVVPQPQLRQLHYRAYERKYTAALNNPQLLRLNAPQNRIAYAPTSRIITPERVLYDAAVLPQNDPLPWGAVGNGGNATVALDRLTLEDVSSIAPYFWTRAADLTFPHAFALAWRFEVVSAPVTLGVWSGLGAGWITDTGRLFLLGYLLDGSDWYVGVLGSSNPSYPALLTDWLTPTLFNPMGQKTYRVVRNGSGLYSVYLDGSVVAAFTVHESNLPYVNSVVGPFSEIQNVFFGSLSREAQSNSIWEFVRYESFPLVFSQTLISTFTNYEANATPETSPSPWDLLGATGYETIESGDTLVLRSTSATTLPDQSGVTGAYRGFLRLEPLLRSSVDTVLDIQVQGRDFTHSTEPFGLFASVYDGKALSHLSLLSYYPTPKISYPGLSLPENAAPIPWVLLGGGVDPGNLDIALEGRSLRVTDLSSTDGVVYYAEDTSPNTDRLLSPSVDYRVEARFRVVSYTADLAGFCGVTFDVFDGAPPANGRPVGVMLREVLGVKHVAIHRDGVVLVSTPFNWGDGVDHTYRLAKDVVGDLLTLFVDDILTLTFTYSAVATSPGNGVVSFGTFTVASVTSHSEVVWSYVNLWRKPLTTHLYTGVWKGVSTGSLLDYLIPTLAQGSGVVQGNTIQDPTASFVVNGVVVGDLVGIDEGPNRGVYPLTNVTPTSLVFGPPSPFSLLNAGVSYRVFKKVDWSSPTRLRLLRVPSGAVELFEGVSSIPSLTLGYDQIPLLPSLTGNASGRIPCVAFGSLDPEHISTSAWDYVRYGAVSVPDASKTINKMFRLNQRNVMASPEHLRTLIPHTHTDYWSSSTGIPPQTGGSDDLHRNPSLTAYTQLNDSTPLVPSTQTLENRRPTPVAVPIGGLNQPQSVLGAPGIVLNNSTTKVVVTVPDDVLYNCLEVVETTTGEPDLITPVQDVGGLISLGTLSFTKEVCLEYNANTLPENDPSASTPWVLVNPGNANVSVSSGVLTYGSFFPVTVYKNDTPLPDVLGHPLKITWRVLISQDGSGGLADSQIRLGFSAPGLTLALAFITTYTGERLVVVKDLNANTIVAGLAFDFLDNAYHTYVVERQLTTPVTLRFRIDP